MTASGVPRSMTAAASPMAAIESRGDGSASTCSAAQVGELGAHGIRVRRPGDDDDPLVGERREPVDGGLEERAAAAGEVEEELGVSGPAQRPQPGPGAARGDDRPEPGDARMDAVARPALAGAPAARHPPSRGNESRTRQTPSWSWW